MDDPKLKLTEVQIRDAGLDGWRQMLGTIEAQFETGSFATGLALVDRIGQAAEEANHHPDILLTYPRVIVRLSSHDVGGITSRDIALARRISEFAAEAGVGSDTGAMSRVEWGLDTPDGDEVAPFWAAITGGAVDDGEVADPTGRHPNLWFQTADDSYVPAEGEVDQRWHPDVWVGHDEAERRIAAALDAGGTLVDDSHAPSFWVLADAQGNRACICTTLQRG